MAAYNVNVMPPSPFGSFSISWPNRKWMALSAVLEAIVDLDEERFSQQRRHLNAVIARLQNICGRYKEDYFTLSEHGQGVVYKASKCFDEVILESLIPTDELTLLKEFYEIMDRQLIDTDKAYKEQLEAFGQSGIDNDKTVYIKLMEKKPWERAMV